MNNIPTWSPGQSSDILRGAPRIITVEDEKLINILSNGNTEIYFLLACVLGLKKVNKTLVVSDIDDTLFTRFFQLQVTKLLDNRGEKGNEVIQKEFGGYKNFVNNNYGPDLLTKELVKIIKNNTSLLLTAGVKEFQKLKIKAGGLGYVPTIVVQRSYMKPIALLEHILSLGKIPNKIDIYDDRVEHFIKWCGNLAKLLKIEINVYEVGLNRTKIDTLRHYQYTSLN